MLRRAHRLFLCVLMSAFATSVWASERHTDATCDLSQVALAPPEQIAEPDEPVWLGVVIPRCATVDSIDIELPAGVTLHEAGEGCSQATPRSGPQTLTCAGESRASASKTLRYQVSAGHTLTEGPLEWPVVVDFGRSEVHGAETIRRNQILSPRATFVSVLSPFDGGVFHVQPGESINLLLAVEHTDILDTAFVQLPSSFSYLGFSPGNPSSVSCNQVGTSVQCGPSAFGSMSVGLTYQAPQTPGTYDGLAFAAASPADSTSPGNADFSEFTIVVVEDDTGSCAGLALNKGFSSEFTNTEGDPVTRLGEEFFWEIELTNPASNDNPATGISLTDPLPSGNTFIGYSGAGWSCAHNPGPNTVTCDLNGSLAPGESASLLRLRVLASEMPPNQSGGVPVYLNSVIASSADCGGTSVEDAPAPVDPGGQGQLVATKRGPGTISSTATVFTWEIDVLNTSSEPATGVTVVDTLPAGITFEGVSGSDPGWNCSGPAGNTLSCDIASIPAGETRTIRIDARFNSASGSQTNTCTLAAADADTNDLPCSHTVTYASDPLIPRPRTTIVRDVSPAGITQEVTYTIYFWHRGPEMQGGGSLSCNSGGYRTTATAQFIPGDGFVQTGVDVDPAFPLGGNGSCPTATTCHVSQLQCISTADNPPPGEVPAVPVPTMTVTGFYTGPGTKTSASENTVSMSQVVTSSHSVDRDVVGDPEVSAAISGAPGQVLAGESVVYTANSQAYGEQNPDQHTAALNFNPSFSPTSVVPSPNTNVNCTGTSCTWSGGTSGATRSVTVEGYYDIDGAFGASVDADVTGEIWGQDTANASTFTEVLRTTDIAVEKIAERSTVYAGELIEWSVLIDNLGPSVATIDVLDTLPAGAALVGYSSSQLDCNDAADTVQCDGVLSAGEGALLEISAQAPAEPATLTNTCEVTSDGVDPNPGNRNCVDTVEVLAAADLVVSKSASSAEVPAGSIFQYSIMLENLGPSAAQAVTIDDDLPAQLELIDVTADSPLDCGASAGVVSCSAATLPVGAYEVIITVRAPNEAGAFHNLCVVDSDTYDPSPIGAESCRDEGVDVIPESDLSIEKYATESVVDAGSVYDYVLVLQNAGPSTAEDVVVTDTLPDEVVFQSVSAESPVECAELGGTVVCGADALPVGSYEIVISVRAPDEAAELTNVCVVETSTHDPAPIRPGDCEDEGVVVDPVSDLSVVKTAPTDPIPAGSPYQYVITLTNAGPSTAENVVITDDLPDEVTLERVVVDAPVECSDAGGIVTCTADELPVGSYQIIIQVRAPSEGGEYSNVCVVESGTADPNPIGSDDCDDGGVTVDPVADLSIVKTAPAEPIVVATEYDYTLTLQNQGPSTAEDVVITDPLPAEVTFVAMSADSPLQCLESAGTVTCEADELPVGSYEVVITVRAPDEGGEFENVCVVESETTDPNPIGIDDCNDDGVVIEPESDLSVAKTAPSEPVTAGSTFEYLITLQNAGPSSAENVVVSDPLPEEVSFQSVSADLPLTCDESSGLVTCSADTLPVGVYEITITVQAPDESGAFNNVCVVETDTSDPDPIGADDCDDGGVVTEPQANLQLNKTVSPNPVTAGGTVEWTIEVLNEGPSTASNVVVEDEIDADFSIESVTPDSNCQVSGQLVTCTIDTLAPDATFAIEVLATAPAEEGEYTNVCTYTSDTSDPDPSDCDDGGLVVEPEADLSLAKTAVVEVEDEHGAVTYEAIDEVGAGSTFFYRLVVSNDGPSTAENVVLVDNLPEELTYVDDEVSGGDCSFDEGTHDLTCLADELSSGSTLTAMVEVVAPTAAMTVVNVAIVESDTPDPAPPEPVEVEVEIVESPSVGGALAATTMTSGIDGTHAVTLRLIVENYGDVPLDDIQIHYDLNETFTQPGTNWAFTSIKSVGSPITLNETFDGDLVTDLLTGDETLGVDAGIELLMELEYAPGPNPGPFLTQFEASGMSTLGDLVTDLSHNGLNPDPDGSGPGNWNDPTPFTYDEDPRIGIAKDIEVATSLGGGLQRFDVALVVQNFGNVDLSSIQVSDDLLAALNGDDSLLYEVGPVSVDGSFTAGNPDFDGTSDLELLGPDQVLSTTDEGYIMFSFTLDLGQEDVGPWLNSALARGTSPHGIEAQDLSQDGYDPNPSGSGDPTDDNEPTPFQPLISDIASHKEQITSSPNGGDPVTWALTVSNLGPDDAEEVQVVDTLPASVAFASTQVPSGWECAHDGSPEGGDVTCTADVMAAGESVVLEITATVLDAGGSLFNTCSASSVMPDPDLDNNDCESDGEAGGLADLQVSKSVLEDTVYVGGNITYLIDITNLGPAAAENFFLEDPLPEGVTFQAVTSDTPIECVAADDMVECSAGSLPVGSYLVTIEARAPEVTGIINNVCVIGSDTGDANPPGIDDCDDGGVDPEPVSEVRYSKVMTPDVVAPGEPFSWVITVVNDGPSAAQNVVVSDAIPDGVQITHALGDDPLQCETDGQDVTCLAASLPVGSYAVTIDAIAPTEEGPITNLCVLQMDTHNPVDPEECEAGGVVTNTGALELHATASTPHVVVGNAFSYQVTLSNTGPVDVEAITVTAGLDGPAAVGDLNSPECVMNGGDVFDCNIALLSVGQSVTATVYLDATGAGLHGLFATATTAQQLDLLASVLDADSSVSILQEGDPGPPDPPEPEPGEEILPIPTLTPAGMIILLLLLMAIGGWMATRQLRGVMG